MRKRVEGKTCVCEFVCICVGCMRDMGKEQSQGREQNIKK